MSLLTISIPNAKIISSNTVVIRNNLIYIPKVELLASITEYINLYSIFNNI